MKEKISICNSGDTKFVRTLRAIMFAKSLSQLQLAELPDIRQSQISNWLCGKTLPNYNSLWLLKNKLDICIENFFD